MISGATDINTGPGCYSSMNSDMALSFSPGLEITMAPCGNAGHSDVYGSSFSKTLRCPLGLRWQPRLLASPWPSLVTVAMDINKDSGCTGPRTQTWPVAAAHAHMSSWPQVAAQATDISMVPVAVQPLDTNMALILMTRVTTKPGLLLRASSVTLPQLGSVLTSMTHVATKDHRDAQIRATTHSHIHARGLCQ